MKWLNPLLVLASFIASALYFPRLPDELPMHWNIQGQVDNYMPKGIAVWIIPALALAVFVLYQVLPSLDPKKKNYRLFFKEWHTIQTTIIGFLVYMQFLILYVSTRPETSFVPLLFLGLGSLFIAVGLNLPKIKQNYFIGVRVPWTLSDETNWKKTHRFAGWCFVGAGFLILAEAYFFWQAPAFVFGSILLAALSPAVYSFLIFKRVLK